MQPRQPNRRNRIKDNTFEALIQHRQALIPGTYTISSYGARLASLPSCEPATASSTNTAHE
ncbi:uncharacterized protein K452DRAFT_9171 [Aplosporella prunicola CBS 121167]|uniref:Uncharacterized protein n=1 Tax=Aplosporella prunicola CBS 121167 TaxID=1176127 RepID=A0A6A6BW52_9PEZI|nr:uncharacterized protein K452DRAFT_9171 [Aplosporella prunicola CBS 121167]KAF2147583.1 hypothetical protein K452DRAFT_9171 [Aplosporella prunicola CBS 121167]